MKPRVRLQSLSSVVMPHPIRRDQALVYSWGRDAKGRWWERFGDDPPGQWTEIVGPAARRGRKPAP